jgi:Arc/MetJ-type ribon-helix-helix transcriptional regulator
MSPRGGRSIGQPVGYRRFAHAAEAIRFAIEELPSELLRGAYLEVDEERYDGEGIRRLYESTDYPLARRAAVSRR